MSQKNCRDPRDVHGIYLDHASTTEDWSSNMDGLYPGNSHSIHLEGIEAAKRIKEAEGHILDHINGHDGRLIWTGSGSQANNLAIQTLACTGELVTTEIEHKSVIQWADYLWAEPVQPEHEGHVDPVKFLDAILDWTKLASIQMVNNETGVVNDVGAIGRAMCHDECYLHTDAIQALGKIKIDVEEMQVDLMTLTAHKVYAPKGLGCLWVRNKVFKDEEAAFNGSMFPYTGTLPTDAIMRFGGVIESLDLKVESDLLALKDDAFLQALRDTEEPFGRTTYGPRVVGLISLHFHQIDADDLVGALSDKNVYVSTGSSCNADSIEPSRVLTAMGRPVEQIESTIRVSFGRMVSVEQCKQAAQIIAETVKELRNGCKSDQDRTC
jgi:cysteine desulfurase